MKLCPTLDGLGVLNDVLLIAKTPVLFLNFRLDDPPLIDLQMLSEREGSRVRVELNGEQWRCHLPHPGKEANRYQVEEARELLERAGVQL